MAPVELSCAINDKEGDPLKAEDEIMAVLETPVGRAYARSSTFVVSRWMMPVERARLATLFPAQEKMVVENDQREITSKEPLMREAVYQTLEGEIMIRAKYVRSDEGRVIIDGLPVII